jgi:AcrR family transcriptional regulator
MTTQRDDFKSLDKSVRRQRIIDAAVKIFHRKGYHPATLDDIANELGLTKAALYHYFSSKEAILSVIYMQAMEFYFAKFADPAQMEQLKLSPPEKLRFFIGNHIRYVAIENLSMLAVFLTEENQLPKEDYRNIRREKRRYNRVLETIIKEGIEQGLFKPADPHLLANAIIGMCNSLYRWYKPDRGSPEPEAVIGLFVDLLETGYLNQAAERPEAVCGRAGGIGREVIEEMVKEQERHQQVMGGLLKRL